MRPVVSGLPIVHRGSLVVFVVWIYYSGLIFFFGAELRLQRRDLPCTCEEV